MDQVERHHDVTNMAEKSTCFAARTAVPRIYLVHLGQKHFERERVTVLPFARFTQELGLP